MTSPRATVVALGLAAALVVAACGIPVDHSPRVLDRKDLPAALVDGSPTTTSAVRGAMVSLPIYLVKTVGPAQVMRSVRVPVPFENSIASQAEAALNALISFTPSSSKAAKGLTNDIPPNLRIHSASLHGNVLELQLSQIDSSVQSTLLRLAFAQMVFTATDLNGIDQVRFIVAGQPATVLLDSGTSKAGEAIGRDDYHELSGK